MYLSLKRQSRPQRAVLAVLALSQRCQEILQQLHLPDLLILPLGSLEQKHPELLNAKANRSTVEYYFTLTPLVILESLNAVPKAKRATYLDSDLYFLSSPAPLWQEIQNSPITMVEHRFSPGYLDKIVYGRFNVGWNTFNRSATAQEALHWWKDSCLKWCYDRIDGNKFADQGYLTEMERVFPNVHVLQYPGINLAEYNLDNYDLTMNGETLFANGKPIIYWHMHCLLEREGGIFKVNLRKDLLDNEVIHTAYARYTQKLYSLNIKLSKLGLPIDLGNARYPSQQ